MRAYFEELEEKNLAPYAVKSKNSLGRQFQEPVSANRTCFQRDRDRVIHSKAFRRLKHKTQVFIATESDHYRSRLTHTIEVAQISRHLARLLRLNEDLAESIALAHDLGHTPFGHSGEHELNRLMANFGGFEHNRQSRRIVDELEIKYPQFNGLNLSYEVREGLIKHRTAWDNPGGNDLATVEAQAVNIADEIAYNNHDLDDGLSAGILVESELNDKVTLWKEAKKFVKSQYANLEDVHLKYQINSYLISSQIEDVVQTTLKQIPKVSFSPEMTDKNKQLRAYLFKNFYSHNDIYRMNKKGQLIIRNLFTAFSEDPKLLPDNFKNRIDKPDTKERVVADYIAGMTDTYAKKEFQTIFE